jgi:hypothetical protein
MRLWKTRLKVLFRREPRIEREVEDRPLSKLPRFRLSHEELDPPLIDPPRETRSHRSG